MKSERTLQQREVAQVQAVSLQRACAAIDRKWSQSGYNPRGHLERTTAKGDGAVLNDFWRRERYDAHGTNLSNYLAMRDMHDVGYAVRANR
jgi:hypothetical protein